MLGDDLKEFHRTFGGRDYEDLLAVEIAKPTLLSFRSLPGALDAWAATGPHPAPTYDHLDLPARDPRIQPDVVAHRAWFPIAEFDGGSTLLYFDDAPTKQGRRGQIIVYQHDPDEVFYVADCFADFLRTSNDLLEASWDDLFP